MDIWRLPPAELTLLIRSREVSAKEVATAALEAGGTSASPVDPVVV